MTEKIFKPKDVLDLFEIKTITKQSLLNYEEKGEIPKAHRDQKTKISKRYWTTDQLPEIGAKFGFKKLLNHQKSSPPTHKKVEVSRLLSLIHLEEH
jgi:chromosome partitioning protein